MTIIIPNHGMVGSVLTLTLDVTIKSVAEL